MSQVNGTILTLRLPLFKNKVHQDIHFHLRLQTYTDKVAHHLPFTLAVTSSAVISKGLHK